MTPEQQRIAIAEACGWRHIKGKKRWNAPTGGWDYLSSLPNYIDDLNAMNEAEKVLTYEQFDEYYVQLSMKMVRPFHATASQRAEAFLRTIGKRVEP